MEFNASATDTVGVELELQLLDARTLDLSNSILPLLAVFPDTPHVKAEMVQNTVEIVSRVSTSSDELEQHLVSLAREVRAKCAEIGLRLCGAGTHPFGRELTLITPRPRYLAMEEQAAFRLHAQTTFATHVHVGVSSGDEAIALMRALKPYLPLLIALSANSPLWRGYDTRCASYRHRILAATRSYGVPPSFADWADFCRFYDATHRAGLFESVNDIHWDLRPRPRFGTLEVRTMDQQATIADAVALAGLVRVLATWLRRAGDARPRGLVQHLPWWTDKENHFQAARLGLGARYIAAADGSVVALRDVWEALRVAIEPVAAELGELDRLAHVDWRVATGVGHERQRRAFERAGDPYDVVVSLVEELEAELGQSSQESSYEAGSNTTRPASAPPLDRRNRTPAQSS